MLQSSWNLWGTLARTVFAAVGSRATSVLPLAALLPVHGVPICGDAPAVAAELVEEADVLEDCCTDVDETEVVDCWDSELDRDQFY